MNILSKQYIKNITSLAIVGSLAVPFVTYAQLSQSDSLTFYAVLLLNRIVAIAVILAFLFFVWGIAKFIRGADDPTARDAGRQQMIWGVVALAVLVSVWGIVYWLQFEFGIIGGGPDIDVGSIYQINP